MKQPKNSLPAGKKTPLQTFIHWLPFYLMGLPGLIYLFINNYIPLAGLQIAFKNFSYKKGMWASPWSGFKNFEFLFKSSDAFIMIRNTILYNVCWIILGMVLGVAAAILINEVIGKIKKKFYMTVILLPYLMSAVIIAYLVYAYLSPTSGLFTKALENLLGKAPSFYQETVWWPFILTFVNQWKGIGFGMIYNGPPVKTTPRKKCVNQDLVILILSRPEPPMSSTRRGSRRGAGSLDRAAMACYNGRPRGYAYNLCPDFAAPSPASAQQASGVLSRPAESGAKQDR